MAFVPAYQRAADIVHEAGGPISKHEIERRLTALGVLREDTAKGRRVATSQILTRAKSKGLIRSLKRGIWESTRLPEPTRCAAHASPDGLVGVPCLGRNNPELIKLALVALLEAGRHLAVLLPDDDEDTIDALQEYVAGALRDQSRHAAMLRLALEAEGAAT
jgi:hypothetical protein